ncbi:MAG: hypothetical protein A2Y63_02115 [Candidatus Riflebacteria bacterium RBG_13_59_9]|nr:MAG: hypothetical protein A2Y63_02115 [Candidatus Riflebacteria bacterium RBG_13_59_9]
MVTRRIVVSGLVQGVGYRYFAERVAHRLRISGYVRNQRDGTVEIVVQLKGGENIDSFLEALRQGPTAAHVRNVEMHSLEGFAEELSGFSVRL